MTKIVANRIDSIPESFLDDITDYARRQPLGHLKSAIAISFDNRYVTDNDGRPLLLIWAHRQSFLSLNLELCMIATKHLRPSHMKEAKELIWEWIKQQKYPIYARCDGKTRKFLEFMGFSKVEELNGAFRYKAIV